MKEHRHAELLRAIADGKEVQFFNYDNGEWTSPRHDWSVAITPFSRDGYEWRIKPEPKPDIVKVIHFDNDIGMTSVFIGYDINHINVNFDFHIKITIDGETGLIKSAEVIK